MRDNRPLAALIAASLASSLGSLMSAVALPWFVLQTTGSASRMGIVLAAESAPLLLLAGPSQRLVRRLGPRTTMLVADGVRVPLVAAVPLLHDAGALSFGVLVALSFMAGAPWAAHAGSETATVPALVGRDPGRIERATAAMQALMRAAYFVGPALGGVLVAAAGPPVVLLVDAASFAVSCGLVLVGVPAVSNASGGGSGRATAMTGWRYLRTDRWLGPVTIASALSQGAFMGMTAAIPVLAYRDYGRHSAIAGALLGAWGGGAMAGALLSLRIAGRPAPVRLASWAWALMAAPLWVIALGPSAAVAAVALAVSGLGNGVRNPPIAGLTARRVPARLLAETMTATNSIVLGGGFLALLGAGLLLGRVSVGVVWGAVAGVQTLAVAVFVLGAGRAAQAVGPANSIASRR